MTAPFQSEAGRPGNPLQKGRAPAQPDGRECRGMPPLPGFKRGVPFSFIHSFQSNLRPAGARPNNETSKPLLAQPDGRECRGIPPLPGFKRGVPFSFIHSNQTCALQAHARTTKRASPFLPNPMGGSAEGYPLCRGSKGVSPFHSFILIKRAPCGRTFEQRRGQAPLPLGEKRPYETLLQLAVDLREVLHRVHRPPEGATHERP